MRRPGGGGGGFRVRAFYRAPPEAPPPGVTAFCGDLCSVSDLTPVLTGADAAVLAFGPRPPYTDVFCASATRAVLAAMQRTGVRRLVCVTGAMVGSYPNLGPGLRFLAARYARARPAGARDRTEQERLVRESAAAWTLVKPPRLTDAPATGCLRYGPEVRPGLLSSVSRADLAALLLELLSVPETAGQTLFVR